MIRLKPIEHIERRLRFELYLELFIVFFLSCTLTFVLPIFIGAKSKGVSHIDEYFEFLSFLYNKNGHSYPFLIICGIIGTTIYSVLQLKNKKAVEFLIEDNQITIICRNTFSGKIVRNVLLKDDLVVSRKSSGFVEEYYRLCKKDKFIGDFSPKLKPWNVKRDFETIEEIKRYILENRN